MKTTIPILVFLFFVDPCFAQISFSHTVEPEKYEGDKPYTPTRIEWLVTEGRNECGSWLGGFSNSSFGLFNVLGEKNKNTIKVSVRFSDEKLRTALQQAAETCARNLRALAKARGWTWLKTDIEVLNRDASINPKGYILSVVPAKSSFSQVGLKAGDVIKTINYLPISSAEDAKKLDEFLNTKKTVRVEYVRDGDTKLTTLEK